MYSSLWNISTNTDSERETVMLPVFFLTLREGLEIVLIVVIMITYLQRTERAHYQKTVWGGVAAATLLSVSLGYFIFTFLGGYDPTIPSDKNALRIFEGLSCLTAAIVLTWMIVWMSKNAFKLGGEIRNAVDSASDDRKANWALFSLAFLTVGREGFETIIILPGMAKGASTIDIILGATMGLGVSILIGFSLAKGSQTFNIKKLFKVSGVLLIFFAAGLVAYGIHELQDAGLFPVLLKGVWNTNHLLYEKEGIGLLLKTLFGYNGDPELIEILAYMSYLFTSLYLFLRPNKTKSLEIGA
jgi:high-affinity iron transporter